MSAKCPNRVVQNRGYIDASLRRNSARGSITFSTLVFVVLVMLLLGATSVGYWFTLHRETRAAADLAALSGAQNFTVNSVLDECSDAKSIAASVATSNGVLASGVTTTCGTWSTANTPAFTPNKTPPNALKVDVNRSSALPFITLANPMAATAIAARTPVAAFSIGTNIIQVCTNQSAFLSPILKGWLGSNICLQSGNQGLLTGQITVLQFKQALASLGISAGTVNQLLASNVSLGTIVTAAVNALNASGTAQLSANVLSSDLAALTVGSLAGIGIKLGNILNVVTTDNQAVLNASLSVENLISVAALSVATKQSFVTLGTGINVGVTDFSAAAVNLKASLIQPPVIAIGGPGTTAISAQVRLYLGITGVTLGSYNLVELPVYVDVAPGKAVLNSLSCAAPKQANFAVTTGVGQVCLANGVGDSTTPFSCPDMSNSANRAANDAPVLNLPLLGNVLGIGINASLTSNAVNIGPMSVGASQTINTSLATALPNAVSNGINLNANLGLLGTLLGNVVNSLLSGLTTSLGPVLGLAGGLLDPVLQALGIGIGTSTVNLISIDCRNLALVQ
ncbi:MAG: pilus assembly protein TadG-related protein [Janthinobacterium lividum]